MLLTRRFMFGLLAASPLIASPAFAVGTAVFAPLGVAISGFDPVGYFTKGAPIAGKAEHRLMWRNAIWQFASHANMSSFERNPHAYAPRYGGYCAMSLTQGQISETQPDAWAIHDGRLYLTHSQAARAIWQRAPVRNISMADAAWPAALCAQ